MSNAYAEKVSSWDAMRLMKKSNRSVLLLALVSGEGF